MPMTIEVLGIRLRRWLAAYHGSESTAGHEGAASLSVSGARRSSGDGKQRCAIAINYLRLHCKKRASVLVPRPREYRRHFAHLKNDPGVQDDHVIGDISDYSQVMGNEDKGRAAFKAQGSQEIENLLLNAVVEARRGFVSHDHVRLSRHRHPDGDALPHPARKFMWILAECDLGIRQFALSNELQRPRTSRGSLGLSMNGQYLADLVADPMQGIEGLQRVLADQRNSGTTNAPASLARSDEVGPCPRKESDRTVQPQAG